MKTNFRQAALAIRFYSNVMTILRQKLIASNRRIDQLLQNQS